MIYTLREYQEIAVLKAIQSLQTKKNGIIVMPTGSGKSLIISEIAHRTKAKTIVLQPTKEILEQNLGKMQNYGIHDIGIYSASMNKKCVGSITFATIGTIIKKKEMFENFDIVIVDEAHKVNSKGGMYEEFLNHLDLPTIGLTATPYRMRNYRDFRSGDFVAESRILTRTRPKIFDKIIHITQIQELFNVGFLCPLEYTCYQDYDSRKIKSTSTEQGFDDAALERYNKEKQIAGKIIGEVSKSDCKHILIFTPFINESDVVISGLKSIGVSCSAVSAETPKKEREYIVDGFRSGEIRCVVNVGVFTTGFDYPELDCVIIGRPTKSVALYYQMVGRGIRPYQGKTSCRLIDLTDNVKRFGKIESFVLYEKIEKSGMWRLKSNVGDLTGVDVVTGKDLEDISRKVTKDDEIKIELGNLIITFGKYEGKKLSEVDTDYLKWASENFNNGRWRTIFSKEYEKRTPRLPEKC